MIIAPSDHLILKEDVFVDKIKTAVDFAANNDALLTLGIQPSRPDTGYGYINYKHEGGSDIKKVNRFTEKPNAEVAQSFLDSGDYVWNAGIFIWSTNSIIEAFKKHAADIHRLLSANTSIFNTEKNRNLLIRNILKPPLFLSIMQSWNRQKISTLYLQILVGPTWEPGVLFMQNLKRMRQEM